MYATCENYEEIIFVILCSYEINSFSAIGPYYYMNTVLLLAMYEISPLSK